MAGSILMLLAICGSAFIRVRFCSRLIAKGGIDPHTQLWLSLPLPPHSPSSPYVAPSFLLPDAHVEAPTAGFRDPCGRFAENGHVWFFALQPDPVPQPAIQAAPVIAVLAVIGIIYGAAVSYAQSDIKKLVAYSSVSHLGFVMLGLFGLSSGHFGRNPADDQHRNPARGRWFLLVGMVYEQTHTREFKVYGGLWKVMPVFGTFFLIVALSSMGLPG